MPYRPIEPGEEVARPRVVRWDDTKHGSGTGYRVNEAFKGLILPDDGGLHAILSTDGFKDFDLEVTSLGGNSFRSVDTARAALDLASRVIEMY